MEITNAQYVRDLLDTNKKYINATIDGTIMTVPLEPANRHYAEILKQVADGTLTIQDAD